MRCRTLQDGLPSRLQFPDSFGSDIAGGIDISVMLLPAFGTCPLPGRKTQFFSFVSADMTGFRACVKRVDLHKHFPCLSCFIGEHAAKRSPSGICNRLGQMVIFEHVLDLQALRADRLVFVNQSLRDSVALRFCAAHRCGHWKPSCAPLPAVCVLFHAAGFLLSCAKASWLYALDSSVHV